MARVDCSGRAGDREEQTGPGRDPEGDSIGPADGLGVGHEGKAESKMAPGSRDWLTPPTQTETTERNGSGETEGDTSGGEGKFPARARNKQGSQWPKADDRSLVGVSHQQGGRHKAERRSGGKAEGRSARGLEPKQGGWGDPAGADREAGGKRTAERQEGALRETARHTASRKFLCRGACWRASLGGTPRVMSAAEPGGAWGLEKAGRGGWTAGALGPGSRTRPRLTRSTPQ